MTTTLSYYAEHKLKLFNEDGTERPFKESERQFLKMVCKAWELGCDLKMVTFGDKRILILEKSNDMQIAVPIHDRVVVRPDKATEKMGDFEIPQDAQKAPKRGTVIAVGPGKHADETGVLIPMQCKEGDVVLYSKFGGTEVELDGEIVVVLKENECLLIVSRM